MFAPELEELPGEIILANNIKKRLKLELELLHDLATSCELRDGVPQWLNFTGNYSGIELFKGISMANLLLEQIKATLALRQCMRNNTPAFVLDIGGGLGLSINDLLSDSTVEEAVEKKLLFLVVLNAGFDINYLLSEEAHFSSQNPDPAYTDKVEKAKINHHSGRVHYRTGALWDTLNCQIGDTPIMGNVIALVEYRCLIHSYIPDLLMWFMNQSLARDGVMLVGSNKPRGIEPKGEYGDPINYLRMEALDRGIGNLLAGGVNLQAGNENLSVYARHGYYFQRNPLGDF